MRTAERSSFIGAAAAGVGTADGVVLVLRPADKTRGRRVDLGARRLRVGEGVEGWERGAVAFRLEAAVEDEGEVGEGDEEDDDLLFIEMEHEYIGSNGERADGGRQGGCFAVLTRMNQPQPDIMGQVVQKRQIW